MATKKGVYLLHNPKVAKEKIKTRAKDIIPTPNIEPPVGLIQGKTPGSKEEWRVALALNSLGMKYYYQYPVNGGRSLRGGQVVDFMVYTAPVPTPVYVNGTYWHRTTKQMSDQLKQLHIVDELQGQCFQPIILWADKLMTVNQAYESLRQNLRWR